MEWVVESLRTGSEGHLDLGECLGAVLHQVLDLAGVDADYAQQEVAGHAEGQGHGGVHDGVWCLVRLGSDVGELSE